MKTLYIECNMGVAGDMLMGALYEVPVSSLSERNKLKSQPAPADWT